jgi:hypothetical protein
MSNPKIDQAVADYRAAKKNYENHNSIINMREVTRTKHIMMEALDRSKPIEDQFETSH